VFDADDDDLWRDNAKYHTPVARSDPKVTRPAARERLATGDLWPRGKPFENAEHAKPDHDRQCVELTLGFRAK